MKEQQKLEFNLARLISSNWQSLMQEMEFDSGVFLKGGSFSSIGTVSIYANGNPQVNATVFMPAREHLLTMFKSCI
ncbi:MAG: hypothetical protein IPL74_08035 [Bacteroidetes bacterium]|nr:hypothetical protein [Bacteroidota bacterium]